MASHAEKYIGYEGCFHSRPVRIIHCWFASGRGMRCTLQYLDTETLESEEDVAWADPALSDMKEAQE